MKDRNLNDRATIGMEHGAVLAKVENDAAFNELVEPRNDTHILEMNADKRKAVISVNREGRVTMHNKERNPEIGYVMINGKREHRSKLITSDR